MVTSYFFDTYAIVELLDGNKNFARFVNEPVTITLFNLAEVYWSALLDYSQEKADEIYSSYKPCVIDVTDEILKEAIKFRKEHKKQNLSYADCIGYICAKHNGLKFLTGDNQFQNIPNVEFVK